MAVSFYKCRTCGNIICKIIDSGVTPSCCGKPMQPLTPGSTDGDVEKHVPVYETKDGLLYVKVGSSPHPMTSDHHIEFIAIETSLGIQLKYIGRDMNVDNCGECCDVPCPINTKAEACFKLLEGEKLIAIYEYCNLHGVFMCSCT